MGHKSSQAGSDSEYSERRVQVNNRRKKNSSSQVSPEDELRKKNNKNSFEGGKVENDYRRDQNDNRISSGGGGILEEGGRRNKNYNKTIREEGELEKDDGEQNTVVVLKVGLNWRKYATDIKEWIRSVGGIESVDRDSNELTVTVEVDKETLRELVGQMVSKKAQSNTSPPSKIRNNSDVEGVGKAENATVAKLPKNPSQTNLNESPLRTAVMMVDLHCQGCIDKIRKVIKKTKGYHGMSIDRQRDAVTVKGTMDMEALANKLSKKLKKRPVSIAPPDDHGGLQADADSPLPEKDMVGGASKTGKGTEPQKEFDGNKSNEPPVTATVLKVDVPCRCIGHSDSIRGVVANTKGFHSCEVSIDDMGKTVVNVTGNVDVNDLKEKLEKKLKKPVEITEPAPIFNDVDDDGSESENGSEVEESKTAGEGGETHTQEAPTWDLYSHMYGSSWGYFFR